MDTGRLNLKGILDASANDSAIILPKGTILERPALPTGGMMRFNTDLGRIETWNGVAWTDLAVPVVGGPPIYDGITLLNNQAVPQVVSNITWPIVSNKLFLVVRYKITRGSNLSQGELTIVADGNPVNTQITEVKTVLGTTGITWGTEITGSNLNLTYTSTATGENAQLSLIESEWQYGPTGAIGLSGTSGFSGVSGHSGVSGISGKSGYSGLSGYSGISGISGTSGFSGVSGTRGISGFSGFSGVSGNSGVSGQSGISGISGVSGEKGDFGGPQGISGCSGISGLRGATGPTGTLFSVQFNGSPQGDASTLNFANNLTASVVGSVATINASGGGGVGLTNRLELPVTSGTLSSGATANLTITGYKTYAILRINVNAAAWVRVYTSTAARTADSSRLQTQDPLPGIGVIAEVITAGSALQLISPGTIGFSSESPATTSIPIAVTNLSGSTASITVTLTIVQLEAN